MMKRINRWLAGGIALLLCVAVLAGCGQKQPEEPVETLPAEQWTEVVARYGDHTLDNAMLSYFYWTSYASFLNYYEGSTQALLDLYTPLDEQYYSEGLTWQDFFIENALMAFRQYCVLCDLAAEAGFTLSDTAQDTIAHAQEKLTELAALMGFETAEEYLWANYGSGANIENYTKYLEMQFITQEYTAVLQENNTFTEEEISAYFDENEESYNNIGITKDDRTMKELRYIMFMPSEATQEAYAQIDEVFDNMLAEWDASEDHSEEAFMALGEKWSEQGAKQDYVAWTSPGVIEYDGVDEWLFDDARETGDTKAVYVDTGDYLFFYVSDCGETYWHHQVYYDMRYGVFMNFLNEKMNGYEFESWPEKIVLYRSADMYE